MWRDSQLIARLGRHCKPQLSSCGTFQSSDRSGYLGVRLVSFWTVQADENLMLCIPVAQFTGFLAHKGNGSTGPLTCYVHITMEERPRTSVMAGTMKINFTESPEGHQVFAFGSSTDLTARKAQGVPQGRLSRSTSGSQKGSTPIKETHPGPPRKATSLPLRRRAPPLHHINEINAALRRPHGTPSATRETAVEAHVRTNGINVEKTDEKDLMPDTENYDLYCGPDGSLPSGKQTLSTAMSASYNSDSGIPGSSIDASAGPKSDSETSLYPTSAHTSCPPHRFRKEGQRLGFGSYGSVYKITCIQCNRVSHWELYLNNSADHRLIGVCAQRHSSNIGETGEAPMRNGCRTQLLYDSEPPAHTGIRPSRAIRRRPATSDFYRVL